MKEKLCKIGNVILYVWSSLLFIIAILVIVRNEDTALAIIPAILMCPGLYWLIHKKWGETKQICVWVFRGITLALGPFAIGYVLLMCPHYRCYDFSIEKQAREIFESNNDMELLEYEKVTSIKKPLDVDYRTVTAMVKYASRQTGQEMQQEVHMYFDCIENLWFDTFEEMRQYRREHAAEQYFTMCHFEMSALDARLDEIIEYVAEDHYEKIQPLLAGACRGDVTESKWKQWQQELSPLGEYQGKRGMSGQQYDFAEDAVNSQTFSVTAKLGYAEGTANLKMTINEELMLEKLEVAKSN